MQLRPCAATDRSALWMATCVAVCCNVLQCVAVAVCCNVWQCVAVGMDCLAVAALYQYTYIYIYIYVYMYTLIATPYPHMCAHYEYVL